MRYRPVRAMLKTFVEAATSAKQEHVLLAFASTARLRKAKQFGRGEHQDASLQLVARVDQPNRSI